MSPVKHSLRIGLLAIVLAATFGCAKAPTPTVPAATPTLAPSVYKIGFLAAITGGAASLGAPERDAAVMVQKQLEAAGSTITGPDGVRHPVQFLIYDTEGSGDNAVTLAKKLIDDEQVVAIVGATRSAEAMALIPVMTEAAVPLIAMASSSGIVEPVAERHWIFKTAQSNKHTAPWQVRYAKALGLTRIANFYVNDAYGEDGAAAIRTAAAAEGLEIVLEETFAAADTDMTAQLTKLRASDAQALLVTAIPPAAAILTKQYRELEIDMPLIQNHGIGMPAFIDLSGADNAEGVVFPMGKMVAISSLPDSDPQKSVLDAFVKDFQASSGNSPSTFAGHAWDAVQITLLALGKLPNGLSLTDQRAQLRDAIERVKGFAGTGGVFNLSAEDHVGLSSDDVVMVRITAGKWEYFPPDKWK